MECHGVDGVTTHRIADRGPADGWEYLRKRLRAEIMSKGFNPDLNSFTQIYGQGQTEAALLVMPPLAA